MIEKINSDSGNDAAKASQPTEPLVKVIAFIATLGGVMFGYDTGVIAGALLFMKHDLHLTSLTTGMVTSFLILGSAVGAACAERVADRFGRKKIILAMALIFMLGSLGCAL